MLSEVKLPNTAIVSAEAYEKAVKMIKDDYISKFNELCEKNDIDTSDEKHLDPEFYRNEIKRIDEGSIKFCVANKNDMPEEILNCYGKDAVDVQKTIIDECTIADKELIKTYKNI